MKLENQFVSLELAKKLKELGVPQSSVFYWDGDIYQIQESSKVEFSSKNYGWKITDKPKFDSEPRGYEFVSAFTVAELGEMLLQYKPNGRTLRTMFVPDSVEKTGLFRIYSENNRDNDDYFIEYGETEADARAKMLIYLIENGLIKLCTPTKTKTKF